MKKYDRSRERAIEWRKGGMALPEICQRLGLGKPTVYYWVKDMPLLHRTEKQTEAQIAGTRAMQEGCAARRLEAYERGKEEASKGVVCGDVRDFATIFLCEGHRKSRNVVSVANSNPRVIEVVAKVMRRFADKGLVFRLAYHKDVDVRKALMFWSRELGIDESQIRYGKAKVDYLSTNRRKIHCLPYGTMSVSLLDTVFRQRIQGWCDWLQASW